MAEATPRHTWDEATVDALLDDGRRRYEVCGSFAQAKARLAEITGQQLRGHGIGNVNLTVAEAVEIWRESRNVKPRTTESYEAIVRRYIEPAFSRARARDIGKHDVQVWLNGLRRRNGTGPLSNGYRRLALAVLSLIMDAAVDQGAIVANPVHMLAKKKKPQRRKLDARILAEGELDRLLATAEPWLRPIILTSLHQALRIGEVLALRWRDVDFDAGTMTVERTVHPDGSFGPPKGGVAATIKLMPEARKTLAAVKLASAATGPDDLVFRNHFGRVHRPTSVRVAFRRGRDRAGLAAKPRPLRWHDLRHTCISILANQPGARLPQVQQFARHTTLQTTYGYITPVEAEEWVEEAATAMAALGGAS